MGNTPHFSINGVGQVNNQSLPRVWDDAQAPGFAVGAGAAAPTIATLCNAASTASDVRLLKYSPTTIDRVHFTVQLPHDLAIPTLAGGGQTIQVRPHVHWTLAPSTGACSTGETVIWEMGYVYASGSTVEASAGRFSTVASTIRTGTYTTSSQADVMGKHFISKFGSGITMSSATASMFIVGTVHISSVATCTRACLLGIDWHYLKQPFGTVGEYSGY